jgi:hypothetical protein
MKKLVIFIVSYAYVKIKKDLIKKEKEKRKRKNEKRDYALEFCKGKNRNFKKCLAKSFGHRLKSFPE